MMRLSMITSFFLFLVLMSCHASQTGNRENTVEQQASILTEPIRTEFVQVSNNQCIKSRYLQCQSYITKMETFKDGKINKFLLAYLIGRPVAIGSVRKNLTIDINEKMVTQGIPLLRDYQQEERDVPLSDESQVKLVDVKPDLLFFQESGAGYTGAAHREIEVSNVVMDRWTYHRVGLKDILIPGAEEKLQDLQLHYILDALLIRESNPDYGSDNLTKKELEKMIETFNTGLSDNWGFDDKHMIFTYPPYETAPFSYSVIHAKIPFVRLKGIIKPEYLKMLNKPSSSR